MWSMLFFLQSVIKYHLASTKSFEFAIYHHSMKVSLLLLQSIIYDNLNKLRFRTHGIILYECFIEIL